MVCYNLPPPPTAEIEGGIIFKAIYHHKLPALSEPGSTVRSCIAMEDMDDLVITPFRDIVKKRNTVTNNGDVRQSTLNAAQSIIKEAERAIESIEPVCKSHLVEHMPDIVVALMENGRWFLANSHLPHRTNPAYR